MKPCKGIKKLLADYVSGELTAADMEHVASHLARCAVCSEEYSLLLKINRGIEGFNIESDQVTDAIDWQAVPQKIMRQIDTEPYSKRLASRGPASFMKIFVPVMTGVFVFGIAIGYLLFHTPVKTNNRFDELSAGTLNKVESAVAKKEILSYLKKSQLVITDLMKQCQSGDQGLDLGYPHIEKARLLLRQNNYFRQNLEDAGLMQAKSLLEKIELFLYEMVSMDESLSCTQLNKLQLLVERERLLLKIRLVEKELSQKIDKYGEV